MGRYISPSTRQIESAYGSNSLTVRETSVGNLTFLNSLLDCIALDQRVDRLMANHLDDRRVRLHQIDPRLMRLRYQRFRAGERAGSRQTVGAIASGPDLLEVTLLRYTKTLGGADGAIDAGRRRPRALSIGTVLRCRAAWRRIAATTGQRARTHVFGLGAIGRHDRLGLLSILCKRKVRVCAESKICILQRFNSC